jgi:CDP-diacylglycerol--glycerol-3-phosphate 3-phosphatidyltransferase
MLEKIELSGRRSLHPFALGLLKLGVTPDMVTWTGTIATIIVALVFFPQGWLWQGGAVLALFIFYRFAGRTMARESGSSSKWGCLSRLHSRPAGRRAIFAECDYYYAAQPDGLLWCAVAIGALVFALVTSYSKARGGRLH